MNNFKKEPEQITLALIEEQLLNIIKYDPAKIVDDEGKVLPLNVISAATRAAIASYEPSTMGTKVRGFNKLTAMAMALKLKGWEKPGKQSPAPEEETIADAANEFDMPELAAMMSEKLEKEFLMPKKDTIHKVRDLQEMENSQFHFLRSSYNSRDTNLFTTSPTPTKYIPPGKPETSTNNCHAPPQKQITPKPKEITSTSV